MTSMTTPPPGQALTAEISDPMERGIAAALDGAGIGFTINPVCGLDFAINGTPVFIEVKQFHSPRIAEQMSRVDNVIAIQGRQAVSWFSALMHRLASRSTAPTRGEGETGDAIDLVVRAKAALQGHIDAIQSAKQGVEIGRPVGQPNPILDCINALPEIVRRLDAGQFEIESAFEEYEDRAPTPPGPVASALADGESAEEPFMFAYENVDKPGEWRAFRQQIKRHDGSICPGRALYTHPPLVTAEAAAARIAELEADRDRQKRRGDNHWETLRSIREFAREGDCARIILWVNDAGSGSSESIEQTLGQMTDRATQAEARADRMAKDLAVIANASERSETMFGGKMSDVTRVFQHISRVAREALREPKSGGGE